MDGVSRPCAALRYGSSARRAGFVLSAVLAVAACATDEDGRVTCLFTDQKCIDDARVRGLHVLLVDAEGNPVDRSGNAVGDSIEARIPAGDPFWHLEAGDTRVEGTIAFMGRDEGSLAVQLVSDDGVNLLLVMPGEGSDEREVEDAFLAFGRDRRCGLVSSDPPFYVRLTLSEGPWLAGRYAGTLACADYSALPVSGAFRLQAGGER